MDQLQLDEELGKGNYGTVKKVLHKPTKVAMAMKVCTTPLTPRSLLTYLSQEIRLELDDAKLNGIIMELDILHRAVAPEIVEFYGAFFIESFVPFRARVRAYAHQSHLQVRVLLHGVHGCGLFGQAPRRGRPRGCSWAHHGEHGARPQISQGRPPDYPSRYVCSGARCPLVLLISVADVKPTNVLVNRKGHVKLCDFGVSGQLEKSLAKTNIGCQSYMAVSVLGVYLRAMTYNRVTISPNVFGASRKTTSALIRYRRTSGRLVFR